MVDWFFILFNFICLFIFLLIIQIPIHQERKSWDKVKIGNEEETVGKCSYWLPATQGSLSLPYSARSLLSRSGTTCYGLSPPILIKNQKMPPHTALWTRVILSFRMTLACAKWTKKLKPLHHCVFRRGASAWESELDSSPGYFRKLWNDTDKDVSARLLTLQCLGQGSPSFEIKDSF